MINMYVGQILIDDVQNEENFRRDMVKLQFGKMAHIMDYAIFWHVSRNVNCAR